MDGGDKQKMKMYRFRWMVVAVAVIIVSGLVEGNYRHVSAQKEASLRRGETRATLDPSVFSDARVKRAYQVAKEIPQVLDSIYCYCQCEESPAFRHKSLLSCYVDTHAST